MAGAAFPSWTFLSEDAREALEWAAACDSRSRDVGTRAVLVGVLRLEPETPAHVLLGFSGIQLLQLFSALKDGDGGFPIDPTVRSRPALADFPPLTANARAALRRAEDLRAFAGRRQLDIECLFGGLLTGPGTALSGLARFIPEATIDAIAHGYPEWLQRGKDSFGTFLLYTTSLTEPVSERDVRSGSKRPPGWTESSRVVLANVRNDSEHSSDLIGIEADARALGALLASHQLTPPLALGLYGEWGSGKTFFMHRIAANIDEFARSGSERGTYCGEVAHVWFNAWHYAEGNLWASLVDHVFTHLDGKGSAYERAMAEAAESLTGTREIARAAEASAAIARARVETAEATLQDSEDRRDAAVAKAAELRGVDVWDAVAVSAEDVGLIDEFHEAAEDLGLQSASRSARELWQQVAEVKRLSSRAVVLSTAGPKWCSPLALGVLALILVGGLSLGLAAFKSHDAWSAGATVLVGQVATVTSALAAWLARQASLARRILRPAERLQARLGSRAETVRVGFEAEIARLADELRIAEADHALAAEELTRAKAASAKAEFQRSEFTGTRLLRRYLAERAASEDYRQHLGVVALARRDFSDLQEFMTAAAQDPGAADRLDRIILYIDDLDRCEPDRVADVLDAVHLLLAIPLFVVVVGVSPNWLSRSLQKRHPVLLGTPEEVGPTSANDYLEKIFQLTYSLRPLQSGDPASFLMSLARVSSRIVSSPRTGQDQISARAATASDFSADSVTIDNGRSSSRMVAPDVIASALALTDDELERLGGIAVLVSSSPRRAQRFLNLYKVLRARYQPGPNDFDGDALMITVALAVGMPASLAGLLNAGADELGDSRSLVSAIGTYVERGSEEDQVWQGFLATNDQSDRLGHLAVDRVRDWIPALWPYLPLAFQSRLQPGAGLVVPSDAGPA